jgi:hypothetical protein
MMRRDEGNRRVPLNASMENLAMPQSTARTWRGKYTTPPLWTCVGGVTIPFHAAVYTRIGSMVRTT